MRRLVIRPGAIGDLIVSLPALESLQSGYLEVWAPTRNLPLIRFADRVRSIPSTGLDLLGVADPPPALLDDLRSFDSIVSWYGANRPEFRQLMEQLRLPVHFLRALPPSHATLHATDFYLAQVRSLCPSLRDPIPRIPCPALHSHYAVIHPFSGSVRKNWPLDKFRQLARGIERHLPVYWCSGPDDPPLTGAIRIDDLYELACWLAGACLFVGNDCGITHLAAAVGIPVLALFGPTDPDVWAPRGNVRVMRWKGR